MKNYLNHHNGLMECDSLTVPLLNELFGKHFELDKDEDNFIRMGYSNLSEDLTLYLFFEPLNDEIKIKPLLGGIIKLFDEVWITDCKIEPVTMEREDGKIVAEINMLYLEAYTWEELLQKNLYFLLPFFPYTFLDEIPSMETDAVKRKKIRDFYERLLETVKYLYMNGKLTDMGKEFIKCTASQVMRNLTLKYPNVHDAVDDLMDRLLIEANEKQKENAIWQGKKKQELKTILESCQR